MLQAPSLAAQSVANGPMTAAQPSFNGHGWLVVINLAIMTFVALLAIGTALRLAGKLFSEGEMRGPLVALLRWIMLFAIGGVAIRTSAEALTLWGWNPLRPIETGWYLTLKRLIDPFGAAGYLVAICIYTMTERTLEEALERKPFPERLVAALPKLRNPAILFCLTLATSILVVEFR